ncbi:outer membrane protein TolC [Chitinophaga dinghuensis]|uniref:Outer membrane protein TolC n=1 Tax=Chitinophaga dinghuensis TaxID=1539050 RepID=A0A327VPU0_9BACT|nr:TolC family protein [Chitinophaga dinghuensis]RAJ77355.1 outer membrane protein TolC [Chitinophaga dinghuensis]
MKVRISLVVMLLCCCYAAKAQQIKLQLEEAVYTAQQNSLDKKIARSSLYSSFWTYQSFKSSLLPSLRLVGTIPNYNRSINKITMPDGKDAFVTQNISYSSMMLQVNQSIGLTGGNLSFYSSLNRIDIFGGRKDQQYSSVPFSISYNQNTLFYNAFKWQKQITPLQYKQSDKAYTEKLESIGETTVAKYFSLLALQKQVFLDMQNLLNADTLFSLTQQKFSIGTRDKNDLLQSQLNLESAKISLQNDKISYEQQRQDFIQYLGLGENDSLQLIIPENLKFFTIDQEKALGEAASNRAKVLEWRIRRLQAEQNVRQAKSQAAPVIGVTANLGMSKSGPDLGNVYRQLEQQQVVAVQLSIPLVDWGVNKAAIRKAAYDKEVTAASIDQENISFRQEILLQTMRWNALQEQLKSAKLALEIGNERYTIAKEKYIKGSLSFTEFNSAQQQKDMSTITWINVLRDYWTMYYTIRRLTLFDFKEGKRIAYNTADF